MKKLLVAFLTLCLATKVCMGQKVSSSDSIKIVKTADKFFDIVQSPNYKEFEKIAAPKIFCLICEGTSIDSDNPYVMGRKAFFTKYLRDFGSYENVKRASLKKGMMLYVEESANAVTMFVETWAPGEYARGHEGAQMELHFVKQGDMFYFTGIASIP